MTIRTTKLIFLLFMLTFSFWVGAQTNQTAKLLQELEKAEQSSLSDSLMLDLLLKIGASYYPDYTDSSIFYYNRSIFLAKKSNNYLVQADAHYGIGRCYYVLGDYNNASASFIHAQELYKKINHKAGIARQYNSLGLIYTIRDEVESAVFNHQKSIQLALEIQDSSILALNYFNLSIIYENEPYLDSALFYIDKALVINIQLKDSFYIAMNYNRKGVTHFNRGEYELSRQNHEYVLTKLNNVNNWELGFTYAGLSQAYQKLGNLRKSTEYGEKSYQIAYELHAMWDLWHVAGILSKSYALSKDYATAYFYLDQFKTLGDSINDADKEDKVNYLLLKQHELENKELLHSDQIKNEQLKNKNLQIYLFVVSTITLLFLIAFLYININKKKHRNKKLLTLNNTIQEQKEKLNSSFNDLKELSQFKEAMTSMIVHDMKNSLNIVINLSKEKMVKEAGRQMLNLVHNIMDTAELEEATLQLNICKVRIDQIVKNAIAEVTFAASLKNISLELDEQSKVAISLDEEITQRIFVNILTNAIKFSHYNSKIKIRILPQNEKILVSITDYGEGIPANQFENIFEKYYQVHSKSIGKIRSTGLGLSFCKMATKSQNGQIWVKSIEGQETTFFIEFSI